MVNGFVIPPNLHTDSGAVREVGYEIELGELSLQAVGCAVQEIFGGELIEESVFLHKIRNSSLGTFTVEIDSGVLTKKKYIRPLHAVGISLEQQQMTALEDSLLKAFSVIVPIEISCPPIPLTDMHLLLPLEEHLRRKGAKGTHAALRYAFGLHINPEVISPDIKHIQPVMQAFLLLYPWIQQQVKVDITRKISPFIDAFPAEYTHLILSSQYSPSIEEFTNDYLEYNATRNRPLDLLPLLAHINEGQVRGVVGAEEKISKRPTFHYRMPNCLIDEDSWSLRTEWNTWAAVEKLAFDSEKLTLLLREYEGLQNNLQIPFVNSWPTVLERYL